MLSKHFLKGGNSQSKKNQIAPDTTLYSVTI